MTKRTPIEGLEWILKHDRFGFGVNWTEDSTPQCEEEQAGYYIQRAIDALHQYEETHTKLFQSIQTMKKECAAICEIVNGLSKGDENDE